MSSIGVAEGQGKDTSLLAFIDLSQTNCLNEAPDHTLKPIVEQKLKNTSPSYLLSDADEQLLLNIHFNQSVRVRSITIQTSESQQAPRDIKLFVNRSTLGFEDVEEMEAAQELSLAQKDVSEGSPIALRFVRFQSVNSLHIFISSNHGGVEETRVDSIEIMGMPVETTKDLSGLRNQEE